MENPLISGNSENDNLCKLNKWVFPKIMVPPKSAILIGFSIISHPFWGTPIFGNIQMFKKDDPVFQAYVGHVGQNGREVLEVIKGSDTRRFRVQVENKYWGPLTWTPKRVRAIQGHCEVLLKKCTISGLVKEIYSLDPDVDPSNLEDRKHMARTNLRPGQSRCFNTFPRVLYHTCDYGSLKSIVSFGLVPGGFPNKSGRTHKFFNPTPPWNADMKKFQGTRAGRPLTLAFDCELLMQMGCKLFRTDEAVMTSDWSVHFVSLPHFVLHHFPVRHFVTAVHSPEATAICSVPVPRKGKCVDAIGSF